MKNTIVLFLIVSALASLAAACHPAGISDDPTQVYAPGTPGFNAALPLPLTGDVIACEKHTDCAVVDLSCCMSNCSEEWIVAVNQGRTMEVFDKNSQQCSDGQICPDIYCFPPYPQCEDGTCTTSTDGWDLCDEDADCMAVELGCCDHCNGGRVMAANKAFETDVRTRFGEACGNGPNGIYKTSCTLMACAEQLARCDAGRCIAYADPSWIQ